MNAVLDSSDKSSPFLLANEHEYQVWRSRKLELNKKLSPDHVFRLDDNGYLSGNDLSAAQQQVDAFNFVLFEAPHDRFGKAGLLKLGRQFGLERLDANLGADPDQVTSLRVVDPPDHRSQYIPYSNSAMNWHTDGYYNPADRRINAFLLFCAHPAGRGGGNYLFDHEMMYLLIRDRAPDLLDALMDETLMRIPANVQGDQVLREEECAPVFSLQAFSGALQMSYTSRPRNIQWKPDARSRQALELLRQILAEGSAAVELRLRQGQGIICNNLLHGRHGFEDDARLPARLVYRARYYDAIRLADQPVPVAAG